MVTMIICIVLLLVGYVLYGKFTEGAFGPDPERKTPAYTKFDGLDYIPMPEQALSLVPSLAQCSARPAICG